LKLKYDDGTAFKFAFNFNLHHYNEAMKFRCGSMMDCDGDRREYAKVGDGAHTVLAGLTGAAGSSMVCARGII
jgi:hypothetical protein